MSESVTKAMTEFLLRETGKARMKTVPMVGRAES
jgi:hypothetical protein